MELGKHIKRHRVEHGLSQEDLAAKIYISRQTVSNWETDKTYPDVQSLLLLSVLFDVTIDELVKGDMEAMKEAIANDAKKMNTLGWAMLGFGLAAFIVLVGGLAFWNWDIVPTVILTMVCFALAATAAARAEHLKVKHDVFTYRELIDFCEGRPVNRENRGSRRAHDYGVVRTILFTLVCACLGGAIGYFGISLILSFTA